MTSLGTGQMAIGIRRREFAATLGSAALTWPLAARAQQPAVPVVGVLGANSPGKFSEALVQGLREFGFVEDRNVRFEYRWAKGAYEQLPHMAAELVALHVNVLAALGTAAVKIAASSTNSSIPVVFAMASDPVAEGLVDSLNRPGRNITGVTSITSTLAPKRVGLMHDLLGSDAAIAILINPDNPLAESERKDAEAASRVLGQRLEVLRARNGSEIVTTFAALASMQIGALIIGTDTFYYGQMQRMATLAVQHAVPAIGPIREFATEGGLMSYGTSIAEVNRQAGILIGKILRGTAAAELPIQQPTKFEFVINLTTAKMLGLTIPPGVFSIADEVIE